MKFTMLFFAINMLIGLTQLQSQPKTHNATQLDTIYLLHLKNFESWPWSHELSSHDSPRHVISQDTMHIEVNGKYRYNSPGIKKVPYFNLGIDVDVVAVHFPKGDTLTVGFSTIVTRNTKEFSIALRTLDTTFQITAANKNDFYFASYRFISKSGRRQAKFYWRFFHNGNTRKQLKQRLLKKLNTNIVHTIKIE